MTDRFLLVRLGAVGDVIHTLPLAGAVRDAFPSSKIFWAVAPGPSVLLEENPDIDQVVVVDSKSWRGRGLLGIPSELRRTFDLLNSPGADVAIDAQGLIKSGVISWASGARMRIGFEQRACREGLNVVFTTHRARAIEGPHHVIEKNLSLLGPLGVSRPLDGEIRFPLPERAGEGEEAESWLRREGLLSGHPLLIMHPGAGWETKRWEAGRYAALGDAWARISAGRTLLTWGPGEEEEAQGVAEAMQTRAALAPPTGIRQLMALIRRADVFAGGDTGPLHLAAALGVKCLALFGPTEPRRNGPWGAGHAVLHHRLACSGCYGRTCPDIECLDLIGADKAILAIRNLWNTHEKSR